MATRSCIRAGAARAFILVLGLSALLTTCTAQSPKPGPQMHTQAELRSFIESISAFLFNGDTPVEVSALDESLLAPTLNKATLAVHVPGNVKARIVHLLSGASMQPTLLAVDGAGNARFDDLDSGHYQVWASAPGQISELVSVSIGDAAGITPKPTELPLLPATSLRVTIVNEAGQGLAAAVTLIPYGHEHAPIFAESDDSGVLLLPSVPRGDWRVRVSAKTHTLPSTEHFTARDPEQNLKVTLSQNASVAGRVVSTSGNVIANALVRVTRVDAGESRDLLMPTGTGPRWVHPLPGKRQMPLRDSRRFGAARDGVRPLECGGGHCGVDLGGKRGWPVIAAADGIVVVSARDDRNKAGRYVAIAHSGGLRSFYMHLDSVAEGIEPGLAIRAGTQLGILGRSGIQHSKPHLHFALSKRDGEQSYFVDPEAMLSFAVLLAMPQEGATTADLLLADLLRADVDGAVGGKAAESNTSRQSDARGLFASGDLAPGSYILHVVHPDLAPGHSERFTLAPGQHLDDLEITLALGHKLVGRVLGVRGKAPGAWVRVYQGEDESRQIVARAQTDAEGYFALRPLMGQLELEAGAPGFGMQSKSILLNKRVPDKLAFDLPAFDSTLRGQIVDPNGAGVALAKVQVLEGPGARGRRVACDSDGFFRLDNVPDGRFKVRVSSLRFPDLEISLEANKVEEVSLVQGGPLRIQLLDQHSGRALSALRVQARGPKGQTTTGISDEHGRIIWPALAIGAWQLSVTSSEYSTLKLRVDISKDPSELFHELKLARGATVAGILRDSKGDRVPGARIWLADVTTESDEDGRFRLEQVVPGDVVLAAKRGETEGNMPLTLYAGDEYLTLDLRLRGTEE